MEVGGRCWLILLALGLIAPQSPLGPALRPAVDFPGADMASGSACTAVKIGIIGGTGLDDPEILEGRTEKYVDTPFGKPSDALILGKIKNVDCVLLASMYVLDRMCEFLLLPFCVQLNSLHEIPPGSSCHTSYLFAFVARWERRVRWLARVLCERAFVPSSASTSVQWKETKHSKEITQRSKASRFSTTVQQQAIREECQTSLRPQTFYDGSHCSARGVCHIPMAEPFCPKTREVLIEMAKKLGLRCHSKGTIVTIEGPRFSSRAESFIFRTWGADVINMTTVPEVVLAKEAGLCYASIAMATDYDCWKEHEEAVSVDGVLKTMKENANKAKSLLLTTIPQIGSMEWSETLRNLKVVAVKLYGEKKRELHQKSSGGMLQMLASSKDSGQLAE
uniref:S-methyl-5'-thioadenosine phosphorylase n=1 Tax=Rattus norvegicus TaxID=10116 RepID=Q7TP15_RAT|nr:Cc1-6 [Rattus norvegicus]|eukprot:NP_001041332.1 S-methyl-5'-thioadenosine phosphorylase precursor [Rattus norvegicus]